MAARLVVVEDDLTQSEMLRQTLSAVGYDVRTFADGQAALEALDLGFQADVVITDVAMPRLDGLALCEALKSSRPELPVILVTANSTVETAVAALRAGAYDFMSKPIEAALLLPCVARAAERQRLAGALRQVTEGLPMAALGLFGHSSAMQRVRELVTRVAASGASVLVTGETGTGKELVARALHEHSARASGPFQAINCAALPAALVESELFGHAKGAFTDARTDKNGLFVAATGGTVFLDEVAELSLENQAKLLRALQERTVRPVGSTTEVPFDVRVLAATHRDLEGEIAAGRFRSDLFFRLNVIRITLPPLRERGMDIVHLATRFLKQVCERDKRNVPALPPAVAQKLLSYPWPGNVRELGNCMERLSALAGPEATSVSDLPDNIRLHERNERAAIALPAETPEEVVTLDQFEKRYVLRVLQIARENRSHAAQMLGIDRRTLYRRLEGWGLPTERHARLRVREDSLG